MTIWLFFKVIGKKSWSGSCGSISIIVWVFCEEAENFSRRFFILLQAMKTRGLSKIEKIAPPRIKS